MNTTLPIGGTTVLSVTAKGTAPLRYQWQFNGVAISGATNSSLALTAVQANSAGTYRVQVTNAWGIAMSSNAVLNVIVPPVFVSQPLGAVVVAGTSATLSVSVTGTAPFQYQWRKDGLNITGATNATLTLDDAQPSQSGTYSVVVANAAGAVTSAGAIVSVAIVPTITAQPASRAVVAGDTVVFSVGVAGTAPAYHWRHNGTNLPGAVGATLTLIDVQPNQAGTYSVVATNIVGSVTSANATLTVRVLPSITTAPVSQTVVAGSSVTFSVVAIGTPPLLFQWVKNGVALAENGPTLSLTNVSLADAGNYQVFAYNDLGSVASVLVVLDVLAPPVFLSTPQPVVVGVRSNAFLSGAANGVPAPGYYWLKDGVRVTNAVAYTGLGTTQLIALAVSAAHAGNYFLVATNVAGAITSPPAALSVLLPPQILTQPVSVAVSRTNPAVAWPVQFTVAATNTDAHAWFYLTATGALPLAGQPWVTNADTATLGLLDVRRTNAGGYFVVLTNLYGTTTSSVANLRVRVPASLGTNGSGPALLPGGRIRLTFGDAEGGAPTAADLANVEVQYATTLTGTNTVWTRLPVTLTGTNGQWFVEDNAPGYSLRRYYRVIER